MGIPQGKVSILGWGMNFSFLISLGRGLCICLLIVPLAFAKDDYSSANFVREAFPDGAPQPDKLWIKNELKADIKEIMGHDLGVLRLRYWQKDHRSAWIVDEIGKERLITSGIVINHGKIESIQILAFRESRGWEIRYPFFTDQFNNAVLNDEHQLDRHIDGISGATLSVRAMKKMARLALLLDQYSKGKE